MARIILVDDSPFLLGQFKSFLEEKGHEIIATGKDGFEGIQLFKELKPDLITLDITMPNLNGQDCLSELLTIDSEAKILIVSAINDQTVLLNCLEKGAAGFIQKPLKFRDELFCKDLLQTIDDIVKLN